MKDRWLFKYFFNETWKMDRNTICKPQIIFCVENVSQYLGVEKIGLCTPVVNAHGQSNKYHSWNINRL